MQHSCPLSTTNPEFSVINFPGYCEFRVENWRLARDGSGRIIKDATGFTWHNGIVVALLSFIWPKIYSVVFRVGIAILSLLLVWGKCSQVLSESVIVLAPHGIQLETHRGFPPFRLSVSRRFIPFVSLQDIVLHEGLRRWDVRYFLVAVKKVGVDNFGLEVMFENILPHHPVASHIYHALHSNFS